MTYTQTRLTSSGGGGLNIESRWVKEIRLRESGSTKASPRLKKSLESHRTSNNRSVCSFTRVVDANPYRPPISTTFVRLERGRF